MQQVLRVLALELLKPPLVSLQVEVLLQVVVWLLQVVVALPQVEVLLTEVVFLLQVEVWLLQVVVWLVLVVLLLLVSWVRIVEFSPLLAQLEACWLALQAAAWPQGLAASRSVAKVWWETW